MIKVLITGAMGTGKTRLAEAMQSELKKVGLKAAIWDMPDRKPAGTANILIVTAEDSDPKGYQTHIHLKDLKHGNTLIRSASSVIRRIW